MRSPPVFTGEIPEKFHVLLADGTSTGPCEVWAQAPACGQLEHPGGPERCHSQAFVHGISWYRIPCRVRTISRSFWHGGIRANSKRHLGTLSFWCSSLFYCQCGLYKTIPKRTGWLMLSKICAVASPKNWSFQHLARIRSEPPKSGDFVFLFRPHRIFRISVAIRCYPRCCPRSPNPGSTSSAHPQVSCTSPLRKNIYQNHEFPNSVLFFSAFDFSCVTAVETTSYAWNPHQSLTLDTVEGVFTYLL